ncbi:hypothetical protein AJ78_07741 [Emergomyces pasteurianus Ep9510]|uniref:Uncharacterized protein n=1 Tax=Emergomyces pasteurianus Ep9510 TaxID=1447872 RepID=A0A1J9P6J2_9EURO|nr:hypothetical protein AJ78_07741 [Emergomyces pasteurianus Ep9510]
MPRSGLNQQRPFARLKCEEENHGCPKCFAGQKPKELVETSPARASGCDYLHTEHRHNCPASTFSLCHEHTITTNMSGTFLVGLFLPEAQRIRCADISCETLLVHSVVTTKTHALAGNFLECQSPNAFDKLDAKKTLNMANPGFSKSGLICEVHRTASAIEAMWKHIMVRTTEVGWWRWSGPCPATARGMKATVRM